MLMSKYFDYADASLCILEALNDNPDTRYAKAFEAYREGHGSVEWREYIIRWARVLHRGWEEAAKEEDEIFELLGCFDFDYIPDALDVIFLLGAPLEPSIKLVREYIEHKRYEIRPPATLITNAHITDALTPTGSLETTPNGDVWYPERMLPSAGARIEGNSATFVPPFFRETLYRTTPTYETLAAAGRDMDAQELPPETQNFRNLLDDPFPQWEVPPEEVQRIREYWLSRRREEVTNILNRPPFPSIPEDI